MYTCKNCGYPVFLIYDKGEREIYIEDEGNLKLVEQCPLCEGPLIGHDDLEFLAEPKILPEVMKAV